jgi:hypothetical protein
MAKQETDRARKGTARYLVAFAIFSGVVIYLMGHALALLRSDFSAAPARMFLEQQTLSAELPSNEGVANSLVALSKAAGLAPDSPSVLTDLAAAEVLASSVDGIARDQQRHLTNSAVLHLGRAVALRPTDSRLYLALARAEFLNGGPSSEFYSAWQHAARLGPFEGVIRRGLLDLFLACEGSERTVEMKQWFLKMYRSGSDRDRSVIREQVRNFGLVLTEELEVNHAGPDQIAGQ